MAELVESPQSGVGGGAGTGYPQNYLGSIIQSPKLDSKGDPKQRSIRDVGMARDVVKTVIMAGRNRSIVNSRILAKYNAERPYDAHKLEAEGLGWRSNFTTKPLPAMIEKVAPRFVSVIDGLKYFTNASLANRWQGSQEKTDKFRAAITSTIRGRKGFRTLVEDIAFDDALFGHTIVAWLDEFSWFPKHFKQDESFVADGTKADPRWGQIVVLKEVYLPHELFDQVRHGLEAAKDAGWDVNNTMLAINRASPVQIRDRLNVGGTLETWYQNALRELTIGASYMAGNSVVVVYTLLAREVTGKVSHYRMAGPEMLKIFEREDRFPSMEDCTSFYTFQKGNGTLHGSKGIGRDIYELAGMLDRTRNEVVDRLIMSGKTLIQGDIRRIHTFKMSVIGNTVIVPTGWNVLEQKMDGNVEGFMQLDAYFQQLVNQLIGSTSTPQPGMGGEDMRSPAAWNLLAQREEEGRDVRITRFMSQFTDMVQAMQKRLCDKDTEEEDAKAMQEELLSIMSREELDELAKHPVAGTISDLTPMQRQLTITVAAEKRGNPLYNQRQLEMEDLSARLNSDFANRVLLPDNDPTEHAEQDRMQNLEIVLLSQGQSVPVSPRDNHVIHLQVLMPASEQIASQILQGQFSTEVLEVMIAHINEHYTQAVQQGIKKETLSEAAMFLSRAGAELAKLKQLDQQAATLSQNSEALAGGAPPGESMAPPGAPMAPPVGP
jgi:hypothetical protein